MIQISNEPMVRLKMEHTYPLNLMREIWRQLGEIVQDVEKQFLLGN